MSDMIERQAAIDAFKTVNLLCGLDGKGRPIEQDDLLCQITGTLLKVPPTPSIPIDWIQQKMYALGVTCNPQNEMIASVLDSLIRAYREEQTNE